MKNISLEPTFFPSFLFFFSSFPFFSLKPNIYRVNHSKSPLHKCHRSQICVILSVYSCNIQEKCVKIYYQPQCKMCSQLSYLSFVLFFPNVQEHFQEEKKLHKYWSKLISTFWNKNPMCILSRNQKIKFYTKIPSIQKK